MNPVRSLAPAAVRGDLAHIWVYVAGPALGALVAVGLAWLLRGPGGDASATVAAEGRPPGSDEAIAGTKATRPRS